jgi:hypothetical protein
MPIRIKADCLPVGNGGRGYLLRLPKMTEQIPLRQATTTTPMVRKTTVRLNALIPFLLANLGLQL